MLCIKGKCETAKTFYWCIQKSYLKGNADKSKFRVLRGKGKIGIGGQCGWEQVLEFVLLICVGCIGHRSNNLLR